MKISAIVATYNGEKYIIEQLDSIYTQTRKVDEVIITDDESIDNTILLCENFIKKFQIDNWKIVNNEKRHGFYENFCNGLEKSTGDLILLCDQDDIWCNDKVEIMENCFEDARVTSLTSTFSRFIENHIIVEHQRHPYKISDKIRKIEFSEFLKFYNYLGMSMMIRKTVILKFLQISEMLTANYKSHDIIINCIAAFDNGLYYLDKVLTNRRSYEKSTSFINRMNEYKESGYHNIRAYSYVDKAKYMNLFKSIAKANGNKDYVSIIEEFEKSYLIRADYIENRKVLTWIKEVKSMQCYIGTKDYLKDLLRMLS